MKIKLNSLVLVFIIALSTGLRLQAFNAAYEEDLYGYYDYYWCRNPAFTCSLCSFLAGGAGLLAGGILLRSGDCKEIDSDCQAGLANFSIGAALCISPLLWTRICPQSLRTKGKARRSAEPVETKDCVIEVVESTPAELPELGN